MNIAYYMPFKPPGHPNPSGDLITGTEVLEHLVTRGHRVELASRLRCRWVYYRPLTLLRLWQQSRQITSRGLQSKPDIWLSYHSYYKAPDLLGPGCCARLGIPYTLFQGIYSTKRRKKLTTRAGYILNRRTLLAADHVFTNKHRDFTNLKRILPEERLSYIAPGINPDDFRFSAEWRKRLRQQWRSADSTVILTAAMMRPGVKTQGIAMVISACRRISQQGLAIVLVVVGDGQNRQYLQKLAEDAFPLKVIFTGRVERNILYRYYSGADIFAFPGLDESLGMVYLEAQSCGLPVVAFEDWGGGEAVVHERTGLISPATIPELFAHNIERLIVDRQLRHQLGSQGPDHIASYHHRSRNYRQLEEKLLALCAESGLRNTTGRRP